MGIERGTPDGIALQIVRYLVRHPEAKDTAEGIAKWWKGTDASEWRSGVLAEALAFLARKQWVLVRETAQGRLFSTNPALLEEMEQFLHSAINKGVREWQHHR